MLSICICNKYILVVSYDVLEKDSFVCVVLYSAGRYYMYGKMGHSGAARVLIQKAKISTDVKIFAT